MDIHVFSAQFTGIMALIRRADKNNRRILCGDYALYSPPAAWQKTLDSSELSARVQKETAARSKGDN
jgi:hypothetical protein